MAEYAVPIWPFGSEDVVINTGVGAAGEMVRVRLTDVFWAGELASVTLNVRAVAFAVTVGVPVIAPVDGFSSKLEGNVPLVRVHV